MTGSPIRLGTRGSALAIAQSRMVRDALLRLRPDRSIELVTIKTQGDRVIDRPLSRVPGRGFFVKEIQQALRNEQVDLAVHSLKDLPVEPVEGLTIAAIPVRKSPFDALLSSGSLSVDRLPKGARVGTSSLRRRYQLALERPDLTFLDLRGNIDTRLKKLANGDYDAIILAEAGLERLGIRKAEAVRIPVDVMLPAVGQGALAIEVRADDQKILEYARGLEDSSTRAAVEAERAFLAALGGGCSAPVGALARIEGRILSLQGVVCDPDGRGLVRDTIEGPIENAEVLARDLAGRLVARGVDESLWTHRPVPYKDEKGNA